MLVCTNKTTLCPASLVPEPWGGIVACLSVGVWLRRVSLGSDLALLSLQPPRDPIFAQRRHRDPCDEGCLQGAARRRSPSA